MKIFFYVVCCLLYIYPQHCFSQVYNPQSSIQDTAFTIHKERKNILPIIPHLYYKAPSLPLNVQDSLNYKVKELPPCLELAPYKIQLKKAKQVTSTVPKKHYIEGGWGNNLSYIESFCNILSKKKYDWHGNFLYQYAPHNMGMLYPCILQDISTVGTYHTQFFTIQPTFQYNKKHYNFNKNDTISLKYWKGILSFLSNHRSSLPYQAQLYGYSIKNNQGKKEKQWCFDGKGLYSFNEYYKLKLAIQGYLTSYSAHTTQKHHLWRLQPTLRFVLKNIQYAIGCNVICQQGYKKMNPLFIYPFLQIQYRLYQNITAYAHFKGDIQQQSWYTMIKKNPYITPLLLEHNQQNIIFHGGFKGSLRRFFTLHTGYSLIQNKKFPLFANNNKQPKRFDVRYTPLTRLRIFAELAYSNRMENVYIAMQGAYFKYMLMSSLMHAWHCPKYTLAISSSYHLYHKLFFTSSFSWLHGSIACIPGKNKIRMLDDVFILNLDITYCFTKNFAILIKLENLLNQHTMQYLYYPMNGLRYVIGLRYGW